jgi:hypothetical protein
MTIPLNEVNFITAPNICPLCPNVPLLDIFNPLLHYLISLFYHPILHIQSFTGYISSPITMVTKLEIKSSVGYILSPYSILHITGAMTALQWISTLTAMARCIMTWGVFFISASHNAPVDCTHHTHDVLYIYCIFTHLYSSHLLSYKYTTNYNIYCTKQVYI